MKKSVRLLVSLIIIVVIVAAVGYFFSNRGSLSGIVKDSGDNISDYSAVFLTNGQVYFGKIDKVNNLEMSITDIYYLQVNQQENLQPADSNKEAAQPEISLVKLGNELHGPNDRMHINRDQILFTESLKSDSKVVKAIEDFKK